MSFVQPTDLVRDDPTAGVFRVHRSSFTSQEVLDLEMERIFERCWLYVGHESEIERRGDFVRRTIARRPVIFLRGSDGEGRVLFNSCRHRGAAVCRAASGNAKAFSCFYHGWTYDTTGRLINVPDESPYGPCFDKSELGLTSPPRVQSYRGFYFMSLNPDAEELPAYLAGAREYIDRLADQSQAGLRIVPGGYRYGTKANWKLMMENFSDTYHFETLHRTYLKFLSSQAGDNRKEWDEYNRVAVFGRRKAYDLDNGHAAIEFGYPTNGRIIAVWHPAFGPAARPGVEAARSRLVERFGEERAAAIADNSVSVIVYPNLILLDIVASILMQVWPVTPGYIEVDNWAIGPRDETPEMLARRIEQFELFVGSAGFGAPDDMEAVESCQEGYAASAGQWSDISRGFHPQSSGDSEANLRAMWREWVANLASETHGAHDEARKPGVGAAAR